MTEAQEKLMVAVPKDDALIWCKRLYWMGKAFREGGQTEAANELQELYSMFFNAAMETLTPDEVSRLADDDRVDTFPEFISED